MNGVWGVVSKIKCHVSKGMGQNCCSYWGNPDIKFLKVVLTEGSDSDVI